jgi:hypothetical protein
LFGWGSGWRLEREPVMETLQVHPVRVDRDLADDEA